MAETDVVEMPFHYEGTAHYEGNLVDMFAQIVKIQASTGQVLGKLADSSKVLSDAEAHRRREAEDARFHKKEELVLIKAADADSFMVVDSTGRRYADEKEFYQQRGLQMLASPAEAGKNGVSHVPL